MAEQLGPLERFVDSTYCFESEVCGGAVKVSFSKYLPWQAMNAAPTSRKRKRNNKVSPQTFQTTLVVAPPS
jgi:hypothetical protein